MWLKRCICLFAATIEAKLAIVDTIDQSALASRGWSISRPLSPQKQITLEIGLTHQNTEQLINTLLDVSHPASPNYGKWLTKQAVDDLVRPSNESAKQVLDWLSQGGVATTQSDGTWIQFQTTIQVANQLLAANFQAYEKAGIQKIRTTSYAVPQQLLQHIDIIHPTTFFSDIAAFESKRLSPGVVERRQFNSSSSTQASATSVQTPIPEPSSSCADIITPDCLREMYNVGNYTPLSSSGSRIGFGSFLNQSYNYEDLQVYEQTFNLTLHSATKIFVNNAANDQSPFSASQYADEANLDVQNIVGLAGSLPVVEFLTGGSPPFIPDVEMPLPADNQNEPYLPYYQYLLQLDEGQTPQVISNSYGEPEQTVPKAYAQRVCMMVAQLTVRGVTILESSGDTGIGSYCKKNDGSNQGTFLPQFPATCPWLTAVGGTQSYAPETAWIDSSGGFSNYWPRPSYQNEALDTYFDNYINNDTLNYYKPYFNQLGRGVPDVAAHSWAPFFDIVIGGERSISGGTSAASPIWAAIVGLINDARLRAGKPSLGFMNPWLYAQYDILVDIDTGASRGCQGINFQTGEADAGGIVIPWAAWNATKGWDPVTGLGIANFKRMVNNTLYNCA